MKTKTMLSLLSSCAVVFSWSRMLSCRLFIKKLTYYFLELKTFPVLTASTYIVHSELARVARASSVSQARRQRYNIFSGPLLARCSMRTVPTPRPGAAYAYKWDARPTLAVGDTALPTLTGALSDFRRISWFSLQRWAVDKSILLKSIDLRSARYQFFIVSSPQKFLFPDLSYDPAGLPRLPDSQRVVRCVITNYKKFIGLTLAPITYLAADRSSGMLEDGVLGGENYAVAWTTSNNVVTLLYELEKQARCTKTMYTLLGQLARRYLVMLGATSLVFASSRFLTAIDIFWKTLFSPLGEIFFHPLTRQVLFDDVFMLKRAGLSSGGVVLAELLEAYSAFLGERQLQLQEAILPELHGEAWVGGESWDSLGYASVWGAFYAAEMRRFSRYAANLLRGGGSLGAAVYKPYNLSILFFQLTNNLKNSSPYRRRFSRIKRRITKKLVKATQRRLWPF